MAKFNSKKKASVLLAENGKAGDDMSSGGRNVSR